MNLWLRLLSMLATVWRRPRAPLFDTTTLHMRVWPNDLDFNGHVNNGRYLTMADLGRLDYVIRSGVARVVIKRRAAPIVGDAVAKFRRELHPFERFKIETRLLGWDERWTFMEHRFISQGRVVGVVAMRGLFRTAQGPLSPQVFVQEFGLTEPSPALPDWVLAWHQGCNRLSERLREEEQPQA